MKRKALSNDSTSKKRKNDDLLSSNSEQVKIVFDDGKTFEANREWFEGYEYFENLLSNSKTNTIKIPKRKSHFFQYILDFLDCCLFYEKVRDEENIDEFKEEAKFYNLQHLFDNLLDMQFSIMKFKDEEKLSGTVQSTIVRPYRNVASGILDFTIKPSQTSYGSDTHRYYFEFEITGNLKGFHIGFVSETNIKDAIMYGCQAPLMGGGVISVWYDFKGSRFVVYVNRAFCSEKPLGEWKSKSCQPIIGATFSGSGKVEYRRNATHPSALKRDNIFADFDDDFGGEFDSDSESDYESD